MKKKKNKIETVTINQFENGYSVTFEYEEYETKTYVFKMIQECLDFIKQNVVE